MITLPELLECIRQSFNEHVQPAVAGSLPQSYARSVSALLEQAIQRSREEAQALQEEIEDLYATLRALAQHLSADENKRVFEALKNPPPPQMPSALSMAAQACALNALFNSVADSVGVDAKAAVNAYITRQIARRSRYLPDLPPPGSF